MNFLSIFVLIPLLMLAGLWAARGIKAIRGGDSAYMYVVQNDGTMLYHPTKEKVGQPN